VWSFLKNSVVIHNPFLYPGIRPSIVCFFIFLSWSQVHCSLLVNREFISVTEMVFLIVCKMFVSFSFFCWQCEMFVAWLTNVTENPEIS
jgi:hypothetical protein